ncbi:MAG: F420-nonreducing hydrogenase, partial [Chitinivibrionales bacterium]|nr:F420-nonreducing hydrogenase [Chitinivibrionales bacterium]
MAAKPKVAFYWCASCGGCEETVVDLEEKILDVVAAVDIVFWPCALDFKYSDVEAMPDGSIAVSFVNGAIRTSEQEHIAKLMRKKSGLVVAFGDCAWMGGIPALANLKSRQAIFARSYVDSPTVVNPGKTLPREKSMLDGLEISLPRFYDTVYKLDDVIPVDYYLPGCPPTSGLFAKAVAAILAGALPPKGSVLAP